MKPRPCSHSLTAALAVAGLALAACTADPGAAGKDGKNGTICTIKDNADGKKALTCDDGTSIVIADGKSGTDGKGCTLTDDANGKKITCGDGTTVTLTSGKDGTAGKDGAAGVNGKSCTVKDNGNGTKTINCEDGTTVTVADGKPGVNGQSCTIKDNGDGTKAINCPGDATVIVSDGKAGKDGTNGKSCTVKDNNDGTKTISCEDGTSVTVSDGKVGAAGKDGGTGKDGAAGANGKSCTVKDNGNGTKTISCEDGTSVVVADGKVGPAGVSGASTGVNVEVKSVSTVATDPIKVVFTLKDDKGYPIDVCGNYSLNTVITPRFSLSVVSKDSAGNTLPYTVLTRSASTTGPTVANPTSLSPLGSNCKPAVTTAGASTGHGTFAENAPGEYTYTFPTADTAAGPVKVGYDAAKMDLTHVLWIQVSRQTDVNYTQNTVTFKATNKEYAFVPSGKATPVRRELVATATCNNCHRGFAPEGTTSGSFHGAGRVEAPYCNVCHNDRKVSATGADNEVANTGVYIHRLHSSDHLNPANLYYGIKFSFPQDIRNCKACHAGSLQQDQYKTRPNRQACTSCHDYVDLKTNTLPKCAKPRKADANGVLEPCQHTAGPQADTACVNCHTPQQIDDSHQTVVPPDPNNIYAKPTGGNTNTNAGYLTAAGFVPSGADVITYDLKEVTTWLDGSVRRPQMTFKFKKNGTDVVFQTYQAGSVTELMAGFVGSPSAYFVFAVPQDGIKMPADFNASASGYIKNVWNGTTSSITVGTVTQGKQGTTDCTASAPCTCAAAPNNCVVPLGSLTLDATTGYYTIKLFTAQVPANATMLQGGLGYTYNLSSAPPLTQINLPKYPYDAATKIGGLVVPPPNVWKPALTKAATTGTMTTGYQGTQLCADKACDCTTAAPCNDWAARRQIVDNKLCLNCHKQLGAAPSFHGGQRNDGQSCSWCHTPNRTSTGWSANSKDFVHAVHGARKRVVPFTWQAFSATQNFGEVEFPGPISNCTACHVAGAFDYSGNAVKAALPNMLPSTVAQGKYNSDPLANSTYFRLSPYVIADNVYSYGSGFSFSSATGLATEATDTTLVKSPITATCSACHDNDPALDHMEAAGGKFYATRAQYKAPGATKEQCLLCHGPGKIAAIATVHK